MDMSGQDLNSGHPPAASRRQPLGYAATDIRPNVPPQPSIDKVSGLKDGHMERDQVNNKIVSGPTTRSSAKSDQGAQESGNTTELELRGKQKPSLADHRQELTVQEHDSSARLHRDGKVKETPDAFLAIRELDDRTVAAQKELQKHVDLLIEKMIEEQQIATKRMNSMEGHYRSQLLTLTEQYRVLQDQRDDFLKRVGSIESGIQQYTLVDTALYYSEATPSLLQNRANSVKKAIQRCAGIFVQKFQEAFHIAPYFPIFISPLVGERVNGPNLVRYMKLASQAFLCDNIFAGFESPSFNICESAFEKPKTLKGKRLNVFNRFVDDDFETFQNENQEFGAFLHQKWHKLLTETCRIPTTDNAAHSVDGQLRNAFGALAMAVWLLHNVAFACEPASAEMFRVPPNSLFDDEYMKEQEDVQRPDSAENVLSGTRAVAFMTVPGFTIRNSIIKADVFCFDSF
ncbi:hypothetical protein KP509_10G064300 [Ceratopteris richardii]|uniref:Uncharacterized protein n=1 Tax=Ceratopteris richardii TaxID=49495 RepID=A0A8T2U1T7_CERRI|nr:hypothetical protein KP509_10G064300 [Ceratopteris richardii]